MPLDSRYDAEMVLADDGLSATARCACRVERETEFVKTKDGWRISRARLA